MTKGGKLVRRGDLRLSPARAEEILHRATELHQEKQDAAGQEAHALSLAELEQMGEELGLDPGDVRAAYRQMRTEALVVGDSRRDLMRPFLGARRIARTRTIEAPADGGLGDRVDRLLTEHSFERVPDRDRGAVWVAAPGMTRAAARAVDFSAGRLPSSVSLALDTARSPDAPESRTDVTLVADLRSARRQAVAASGVGALFFSALGVVGGLLVGPWALAPAAVLALGTVGLARAGYRSDRKKTTEVLEQLLDDLEASASE